MDDGIKDFTICNEMCYFLLNTCKLISYNFQTEEIKKIFISDTIITITSTSQFLIGSTTHQIYNLTKSELIYEFPIHQKIKKIVSGLEHVAVLTENGDLFTFGCGLRGQLGHGDVNSHEKPTLVEALAGIKIIDVSCGGFSTIALSSFNDVYSFGWNTNGQLGLKKAPQGTFPKDEEIKCQQVFTLPKLIDLEDEDEAINGVYCGHKHTILKAGGRLFAAGLNTYGQLGFSSNEKDIDKFTEIPIKIKAVDGRNFSIICGYWTTYIING